MATADVLRQIARQYGNGKYGDCKECHKGIYQDSRGHWRSIMGNLGKGHDHKPVEVKRA